MGGMTIPLLKYLKIEMGGHGHGHGSGKKEEKNDHERRYADKSWFMKIDRTYVKPFFTKTAAYVFLLLNLFSSFSQIFFRS